MKGLELPINVLVLIAVAVIVLLGIVALYFTGFLGPSGQVTLSTVTSTACGSWQRQNYPDASNIEISNYDANGDNSLNPASDCTGDNLETLGEEKYATAACVDTTAGENDIRTRVCGFP